MKNPFKSASHIEQEPKQNLSDLQFVASLQHKIDILESFIKHSLFNIYVNKFHCEHFEVDIDQQIERKDSTMHLTIRIKYPVQMITIFSKIHILLRK